MSHTSQALQEPLRILMVLQHVNFFRNLDGVVRELSSRGHEIVMVHGSRLDDERVRAKLTAKLASIGRGLELAESEVPRVSIGYRQEPTEKRHQALKQGRQVINRSIYLRSGHPAPDRVRKGIEKQLSRRLRKLVRTRPGRAVLRWRHILRVWRWIELAIPASPSIVAAIRELRPDVVLVSPSVWPKGCVEADYIRAARALQIPTIGYVNSWDNLTSKGTVHVVPDRFIVWNEELAEEAETLHDVPREVIRVTGAPHLDHFFQLTMTASRVELCREMGFEDREYVVYLCSSKTLIETEVPIVTALADGLARRFPEGAPMLVVRPHPINSEPWARYHHPGVVVHPRHGDQADTPAAWQAYYNQLAAASCSIGLNTTAFLEAAVADRPCLTVLSDEFRCVQGETGHFRHLLAGDFLEVSADVDEVVERIARISAGEDEKGDRRRMFAESFLRPRGLAIPAAEVVADEIEAVASTAAVSRGSLTAQESTRLAPVDPGAL